MSASGANLEGNPTPVLAWSGLPASYQEPKWYAVFTNSNHEKGVADQLASRAVEHFLPLYESMRQWKDRRVRLQRPLFPGYVFVRIALRDRLRVQQIRGVARLVEFGGIPAALNDDEIEILRKSLTSEARAKPHPFLTTGRHVRIKTGPLAGMTGILLRRNRKSRVVISISLIQRSMAVDADASDVELVV